MAKYYRNRGEVVTELAEIIESLKVSALEEEKEYLMDPITYVRYVVGSNTCRTEW
jgi:hypothetical protein